MQGRKVDAALSAIGQRQADETASFLAARQLDAVYASPMIRAQETAAAIAKPHDLKVIPIDAIIEADLGTWEGLSWDDIRQRDLDAYQKFIASRTSMDMAVARASPTSAIGRYPRSNRFSQGTRAASWRSSRTASSSGRASRTSSECRLPKRGDFHRRRAGCRCCATRREQLEVATFNATFHLAHGRRLMRQRPPRRYRGMTRRK